MSAVRAPGRAIRATPVAEYVRMSTDMQQYSIDNQRAEIKRYADEHGMIVVRRYADEGRSGLDLEGRAGLQQLLADVAAFPPFSAVLVLDVSRWGRFQNADQAAFYEYMCVMHGVRVVYVAEPFENDRSPLTAVLKSLKRHLAAEYSRELSAKVKAGQARLAKLGFHMGASPGYGYRRMLTDAAGNPRRMLRPGEYKAVITDRVVLVPGPADEVDLVRDVFRLAAEGISTYRIAQQLNEAGRLTARGRPWREQRIRSMIENPKYAGFCIYGRTTKSIGAKPGRCPHWVESRGTHQPLVSVELFREANAIRKGRGESRSDERALADLKEVLEREGRLTLRIIDDAPGVLSAQAYVRRFGSLRAVYERLGYRTSRDFTYADVRQRIRPWRESMLRFVAERLMDGGSDVERRGWVLRIDDAWTVAFDTLKSVRASNSRWWRITQVHPAADITVFARMAVDGSAPLDFLVIPRCAFIEPLTVGRRPVTTEPFTYLSLGVLFDLAKSTRRQRLCG
ncbi:recombinase family protein [Luteibacter jiangsuensis]|nr:recombinase family protein [Luteibacter jiangsuensis]